MSQITGNGSAQQILMMLRQNFLAELPERIQSLEDLTLQLTEASRFKEVFEDLYRKTHSLKGSGGTHGMPIITLICHEFEEWLNQLNPTCAAPEITVGLGYIDLLRRAQNQYVTDQDDFSAIERDLHDLATPPAAEHRYRVLLVENTRLTRAVCLSLLAPYNAEVKTMDNGYEALGELLRREYHLLITSKELPQLNGWALLAAVRHSDGVNKQIRTILLTSKQDVPRCEDLRPEAVITKSVGLDQTLQKVLDRLLTEA